ncbi:hypothetical protein ACP275_01G040600 [Erythranthe tilingii]
MYASWGVVHRWADPVVVSRPYCPFVPVIQPVRGLNVSRSVYHNAKALSSVANTDTVVATDDNYGHKEVISVNPRLYDYLLANVREPEVLISKIFVFSFSCFREFIAVLVSFILPFQILRELREETATLRGSQMQVSPDQAQLLAMLVQILGAERCIEVGVYTGYSSLAVALALPEGGQIVACERDAKSLEVAQRYYERAGVSNKVNVKHGLAADTLKSMIQNGEGGSS